MGEGGRMKKKVVFEGVLFEEYAEDGGLMIKGDRRKIKDISISSVVWDAIRDMVGKEDVGKELEYFGKHKVKLDIEVVKVE